MGRPTRQASFADLTCARCRCKLSHKLHVLAPSRSQHDVRERIPGLRRLAIAQENATSRILTSSQDRPDRQQTGEDPEAGKEINNIREDR
jgi:hypothetical protein